jgi:hypothetical protein
MFPSELANSQVVVSLLALLLTLLLRQSRRILAD